jgi:hypothetical protein
MSGSKTLKIIDKMASIVENIIPLPTIEDRYYKYLPASVRETAAHYHT